MNANGKKIDVWLVYGCRACDHTRNMSVIERTPIRRVPPDFRRAAETNDVVLAHRLARDLAVLRRNSARLAEPDTWRISWATATIALNRPSTVDLTFPEPLLVPILAVAAELLGTSTSELARLRQASRVEVAGPAKLTGLRLWRSAEIIIYPPSREKDPPGAPQ